MRIHNYVKKRMMYGGIGRRIGSMGDVLQRFAVAG